MIGSSLVLKRTHPVQLSASETPTQTLSGRGLEVRGVSKRFGPTVALDGVDLTVAPGEIVGLMGANGAGKSTLVNILAGVFHAEAGDIRLDGNRIRPATPKAAIAEGVVAIHQATDRAGVPGLTVADALLLDRFADGRTGIFVSPHSVRGEAETIARQAGFNLPLDEDFGEIGTAERQLVAIARALSAKPKLLILDEPTASLSAAEADRLFAILDDLAARGMAIIYISHRTADLERLASRVVVLRGGRVVATQSRPVDFSVAVEAMIGRPVASVRPPARTGGAVRLLIRELRFFPNSRPIDLDIREGEVMALIGPLGSGKSRLLNILFGAEAAYSGEVLLDGTPFRPRSPRDAIAGGVFLAGEDRKRTSFVPADWPGGTVAAAIAQPHLRRWFPTGFLVRRKERQAAEHGISSLGIRTSGPFARLDTLSGGNQQKVVLARWQAEPARLLLLDEPFQGVDVGARADIIAAIRAQDRVATLIATSDAEEAFEVADRVLVLDKTGLHATGGAGATPTGH
jgi:simple sugar transport system ATP-binding protein